jgi:SSS family solute:Na+ symporter
MFLSNLVGPDIYSKLFSARNPKEAGRGAIAGGLIRLAVSLTVASIALLGASLYGDEVSGGTLLPHLTYDFFPPLVASIVMIGLLSIMLSSADSCLISASTFLSWDLLGIRDRWIRPVSILSIGSLSFILAVYSPGIISTLTLTYTVFSAGMVPAVLLSVWKQRICLNRWGAVTSFACGGIAVLILYILQNNGQWDGSLLFVPMTISTASLLVVSWTARQLGHE